MLQLPQSFFVAYFNLVSANQVLKSQTQINLTVTLPQRVLQLISRLTKAMSSYGCVGIALLCLSGITVSHATEALTNINLAPAAELASNLPGIGPAKATAIVQYREQHGPFKTVDSLVNVSGIGPGILAKIRDLVVVDSSGNDDAKQPLSQLKSSKVKSSKTFAQHETAAQHAVKAALTLAARHAARLK